LPDPEGKAVTFGFEGPVLNVYATLAVRLSHSGIFTKKEMWKNAAAYTARVGGTCGMFLREIEEGRGELTLFFDTAASEETRFQFEEYVQTHLQRRALPESIYRRRIFVCSECETPVTDLQAKRRRERGFDWIECNVCGERVLLLDREERLAGARPSAVPEMDRAADAQRDLDAGLVSAAAEMQTQGFKGWVGGSKATLTLVFTDIVGSTALGNELGNEAMNEVRRAHFKQARQLIKKHGGYEIKTIGDSLMIAFRTVVEALNFALELHVNTGHEQVKIRAGVHVGQVYIEEGDTFGTMVNYAARVESQAKGAEIYVSNRVKEDIDEEKAKAHKGLYWTEHPDCELKGFPGKHKLWSVVVSQKAG
jgi:class 3 adenylate cyclase